MAAPENVELLRKDAYCKEAGRLDIWGWPEAQLTFGQMYELIGPRLENDNQRNVVKATLNAFGDTAQNSELGANFIDVIATFGSFVSGRLTAPQLMANLQNTLRKSLGENRSNNHPSLDIALECVNKEMEAIKAKTGGVKVTSFDEMIARKRDDNKIQIKALFGINVDKLDLYDNERDMFPESSYSAEYLVNRIEAKLKNDTQKNAVREMVNQFTRTDSPHMNLYSGFMKESNSLLKDEIDADKFMLNLERRVNNFDLKLEANANFQQAYNYISEDCDRQRREAAEKERRELDKQKSAAMPRLNIEIPPVNQDSVLLLNTLTQRADDAKGRWKDSKQYKAFYNTLNSAREMLQELHHLNEVDGGYVELNSLSSDTRKLLKKSYRLGNGNTTIEKEELLKAYQDTFKNVRACAKAYEKYKYDQKAPNRFNSDDKGKLELTSIFSGRALKFENQKERIL